jgi:hypothetical protein
MDRIDWSAFDSSLQRAVSQDAASALQNFIRVAQTAFPDLEHRRRIIAAMHESDKVEFEVIILGKVQDSAENELLVDEEGAPVRAAIRRLSDKKLVTPEDLGFSGAAGGSLRFQISAVWDVEVRDLREGGKSWCELNLKDEKENAALHLLDEDPVEQAPASQQHVGCAQQLDNGLIVYPLAKGHETAMPAVACKHNGMRLSACPHNRPRSDAPKGNRTKPMRLGVRLVVGPREGSESAADYEPFSPALPGSSRPFTVRTGRSAAPGRRGRVSQPVGIASARSPRNHRRRAPSSSGASSLQGVKKISRAQQVQKSSQGEKGKPSAPPVRAAWDSFAGPFYAVTGDLPQAGMEVFSVDEPRPEGYSCFVVSLNDADAESVNVLWTRQLWERLASAQQYSSPWDYLCGGNNDAPRLLCILYQRSSDGSVAVNGRAYERIKGVGLRANGHEFMMNLVEIREINNILECAHSKAIAVHQMQPQRSWPDYQIDGQSVAELKESYVPYKVDHNCEVTPLEASVWHGFSRSDGGQQIHLLSHLTDMLNPGTHTGLLSILLVTC